MPEYAEYPFPDPLTLYRTTAQAAALLGLAWPGSVRRLCRLGRLVGAVQLGGTRGEWLVPLAGIEAYIRARRPPGRPRRSPKEQPPG